MNKKPIILIITSMIYSVAIAQKPNIIVIFADDLGYGDLGCYGSGLNRTPNLDKLANGGVRFTDCYSAANVCSPSRAALLTGRYPIRSGIVNVLHPWQTTGIDSSEVTMPHIPLFASDQFKGKSKNGLYGDVIEELDWSVGEILNKLQELKLDDNTLIVFSSDNGPWLTQGPNGGSANPLFQGKMTTWEGGHRVPAIAYWKGKIKPKTYKGMITLMDWFPTFIQLTQASLPDNRILDGCDLTDIILKNGKRANEEFFFFQGARISACRSGDFKLILPEGLRKGNQYVADVAAHDTVLFNLRKDVGESTNLVKANPGKVGEMSYNLDEFRVSISKLKGKAGEPRPKDWPR